MAQAAFCALLIRSANARQAGMIGWLFATVWLSATFWWLFVAMHTYAGLPAVLTAVAIAALAAALGLYYAAVCAWFWRVADQRPWRAALAFAALWTLAEMARGIWLTGFGWGAVGYAHVDGPLAWYAPWVGAYGMTALAAWLAMVLATLHPRHWRAPAAALAVLVLPFVAPAQWNAWTRPEGGSLEVTLLQGNIPQDEKFQPGSGVPLALQWYGEQLQAARGDLVVAPETAIPLLPQQLPEGYWDALQSRFARGGQSALIGIPLGNYAEGYTNAVVGLTAGQGPWRYDKHHLVPFGEFIPPMFKWFTTLMNIPLGDFNRGAVGQPSFVAHGQRLAPNICYEDLFGEELGARFRDPASAPTVFVNVSNIGWFGDTVAIDQHLNISRMRALEFQRPFVRATNTGATVILDHQARVTASLPRLTRGVLQGSVQGRTGTTPFAWWVSRVGLWPLWLVTFAAWAWVVSRRRSVG